MRQIEEQDIARRRAQPAAALPGPSGWALDSPLAAFPPSVPRHSCAGSGGDASDDPQAAATAAWRPAAQRELLRHASDPPFHPQVRACPCED